jgi:tripartite-type tricarboxylate transporter receptor subunit TctC
MHLTAYATRGLMLGAAIAVAGLLAAPSHAADFYAGKQIDFQIGGNPGGGYDTYARTVGRHLSKHIPGNPSIINKNVPGAGSAKLATYIYNIAPKTGLVIGAVYPGAIMGPLLDPKLKGRYDPTKFEYLGSADSGSRVCLTRKESKIKTFEDATKQKTILGASQAGGSTRDYAVFLNATAGSKFEIVSGYKGSVDILLAVERGEVEGLCGFDWSSLLSQRPQWAEKGAINILVQMAPEADEGLTKMGVPDFWKYMKTEEHKQMGVLLVTQQIFGRPYMAPPGTPKDRVAILRKGMWATLNDPDYKKDAIRARLSVNPASGEKVQELVLKLYATPAPVVEKAKAVMLPPASAKKKKKSQ